MFKITGETTIFNAAPYVIVPKGDFTGILGENAQKIKTVIKDSPEVVMFTEYQHFALGFPHTMYVRDNKLPTIFNTSSASQVADCCDRIKKK